MSPRPNMSRAGGPFPDSARAGRQGIGPVFLFIAPCESPDPSLTRVKACLRYASCDFPVLLVNHHSSALAPIHFLNIANHSRLYAQTFAASAFGVNRTLLGNDDLHLRR